MYRYGDFTRFTPPVNLYGSTQACDFGPNKLRAVREHLILRGNASQAKYDDNGKLLESGDPLSRGYVNALIRDMLRMFLTVTDFGGR